MTIRCNVPISMMMAVVVLLTAEPVGAHDAAFSRCHRFDLLLRYPSLHHGLLTCRREIEINFRCGCDHSRKLIRTDSGTRQLDNALVL